MNTNKKIARMAGFLYLSYLLTTIFGSIVSSNLVISGDAAATASQIMASEWRLRADFMSELVAGGLFLLTAWALFVLLEPVHKKLAILFVFLNLGGVAVQSINTLNQFAPLLLLSGADGLKALPAGQLQALAMLFLELHDHGFMIAQIFYGAWLFPLGYLVYRSGFLPRILGIVLMAHCAAWLMTFLQFFLFPGFEAITLVSYPLGFIAEFGLSLWLVVMGVKEQTPA